MPKKKESSPPSASHTTREDKRISKVKDTLRGTSGWKKKTVRIDRKRTRITEGEFKEYSSEVDRKNKNRFLATPYGLLAKRSISRELYDRLNTVVIPPGKKLPDNKISEISDILEGTKLIPFGKSITLDDYTAPRKKENPLYLIKLNETKKMQELILQYLVPFRVEVGSVKYDLVFDEKTGTHSYQIHTKKTTVP
ncbi:MAG TPA: hypothetical protein VKE88_03820 [Candidatus Nanoarchaeia archaeon]|nr:hypothetical protein [Candidatus Nanoarchaeia archaeon]